MSCKHPIEHINPTIEQGRFRCTACRSVLGMVNVLRITQTGFARLAKVEQFLASEGAEVCEGCGEWGRDGFVNLECTGSWCPECLVEQANQPDSAVSEILMDKGSHGARELREHLTPQLLNDWGRWRTAYNQLKKLFPEVLTGYCAKDLDE